MPSFTKEDLSRIAKMINVYFNGSLNRNNTKTGFILLIFEKSINDVKVAEIGTISNVCSEKNLGDLLREIAEGCDENNETRFD